MQHSDNEHNYKNNEKTFDLIDSIKVHVYTFSLRKTIQNK